MDADPVAQLLSDPRFKGQPITWGVTSEGYDAIRRAWLTHVHAEEVLFKPFTEDEFNTQMKIMLSVFTDDCVMELVPAGKRWEGHGQAAEFYRVFLSSLEGMEWVPQALVIGPQGVLDVVNMSGKLVKEIDDVRASAIAVSPKGDVAILCGDRRRNLANSVSALVDAGLVRGLRKLVAEALFGERSAAGAAYLKSGRRLDRRPA